MALFGKKEGGGTGSESSKFRGFIVVLVVLAILAGLYVYFFHIRESQGVDTAAQLSGPPSVRSVLGEATSPEYLKLLEQENIRRTEEARKKGQSAITTVVRASYIGAGEFGVPDETKPGCSVAELQRARESGVSAAELRCLGCPLEALKAAGYTAAELAAAGYTAEQLRAAGFTAAELKAAGFSAAELRRAGYSITDLKDAGFTASELSQAGFTPDELIFAGFTKADLAAAGVGITAAKVDCDIENLKRARESGITAAQIRQSGCGAATMRAAGYTAAELRAAGFSVEELKAAGYSARELLDAGFSAGELRKAGYTASQLRAAGLSAPELKAAGFSAAELKAAGFTAAELKEAGFSEGDLLRAGYSRDEVVAQAALCDVNTLKKIRADKTLSSCTLKTILDTLGCNSVSFEQAGMTIFELIGLGFQQDALTKLGYSQTDLLTAEAQISNRCSSDAIKSAKERKLSARSLRQSGCSLKILREQGFNARELISAGACTTELAQAGFSTNEIEEGLKPAPVVVAAADGAAIPGRKTSDELAYDALEQEQEGRLTAQDRMDEIERVQVSMTREARNMINGWVPPEQQQFVEGDEPPKKAEGDEEGELGLNGANARTLTGAPVAASGTAQISGIQTGGGAGAGGAAGNVAQFPVRAGDVMFGVLDTSINSDEESPILATIVSGKLKGARLVGTFAQVQKKVVLNFNLLSVPWLSQSVPIQAVAIDPNTARTAIAHKVDNHYMQRYGGLFASSFLSGLAEAISSSGQQTSSGAGGLLATNDQLSTGEKIAVAIGKVGEEYANVLGESFTRPPTVTLEQGTGIGLLFMVDAAIPLEE